MTDRRLTVLSSNRTSRAGNDHVYGDLRRKLAQMDSSVVSLNTPPAPAPPSVTSPGMSEGDFPGISSPRQPATSPRPPSSLADTDAARDLMSPFQRPSSPSAESLASNTYQFPSGIRTSKRGLQVGDGRKAAPAIGAVNTEAMATGVLEAAVKLRAELGSEDPSGRASPISFVGTARKDSRLRAPVPVPASTTYGKSSVFFESCKL